MNPIAQYEQAAKQICRSSDDSEAKAQHLSHLARSIRDYLRRIEGAMAKDTDEWHRLAIGRAKKYLERLALDALDMAAQCHARSEGPSSRAKLPGIPYAATESAHGGAPRAVGPVLPTSWAALRGIGRRSA